MVVSSGKGRGQVGNKSRSLKHVRERSLKRERSVQACHVTAERESEERSIHGK